MRLSPLLPSLIGEDQSGFIKGRQITDKTRRVLNIIDHLNRTAQEAVLVTLDAEKAFDRLNWPFAFSVLDNFNINKSFSTAIKALYSHPSAQVFVNGAVSDEFLISNGTRQGCPLSPLIFVLSIEPLAQAIRLHPHITGIKVGNQKHSISLYADDIMLTLTHPELSLSSALETINLFGNLSYYKVNESKSQILPMNLPPASIYNLKQSFQWDWQSQNIKYLGISIAYSISHLYQANYVPLLNTIKKDLSTYIKHEVSWLGRIATFQMFTLPKMLYIFRTVPIKVPQAFFTEAQKLINSFIWANKKPRIAASILYKHKLHGGLGLPNVRDYFLASHINQLRHWWTGDLSKSWTRIESSCVPQDNLKALLINALTKHPINTSSLPYFVSTSIYYWQIFHRDSTASSMSLMSAAPIQLIELLLPDINLNLWKAKGLLLLSDLFIGQHLKSFQSLTTEFNIPHKEFYKFLQIRHLIQTQCPYQVMANKPLIDLWNKSQPISYPVGLRPLYLALGNKEKFIKSAPYLAWDIELQTAISISEWESAFHFIQKTFKCASHVEAVVKTTLRWYFTPDRLHRIYSNTSHLCWRNCGGRGTLFHILWTCPSLTLLWQSVFHLASSFWGQNIPPNPKLALFFIGISSIPLPFRIPIAHIFMATKLAITRYWRNGKIPSQEEILAIVNNNCIYEKIMAQANHMVSKYYIQWHKWISFSKKL